MNAEQIKFEIMGSKFSNDQLNEIVDAVKYARARLTERNKRGMRLGDQVSFTSSKTGRVMQGTVEKIAIKFVTVKTNMGLWRVPANMLTIVEKELA
jgi:ribosomal protein L35AE/L33A